MSDRMIIKKRNQLMVSMIWIFLLIDILINFLAGNTTDVKLIMITAIPCLLLTTYFVKNNILPMLTMYLISTLFIAILFFLNIKQKGYINLFFLVLPPIFSVTYRNWKNILLATVGSAGVFCYFVIQNGKYFYINWKLSDLYYFLFFFLTFAALNIYESIFSEGIRTQLADELNKVNQLQGKQKEAAELLKESETKYRLIADNMSDFVTVVDHKGKILYASPSHENLMRVSISEFEGTFLLDYIHPDDHALFLTTFHHALQQRSILQADVRWKVKDEWIHLGMIGKPVVEKNGEILKIVVAARNITKRVRMEEKIKQTSARLEALISNIPYGILAEDKDNRLILLNQQFKEIFAIPAISSDQLIGITPDEFPAQGKNIFIEEDLYIKRSEEIIKKREKVLNEEWEFKDGRIVSRDAIPIFVNNQFDGFLWQFKDITEQKRLEKKFKEDSLLDGLTKIPNRRFFDETISKEWSRCARASKSLTIIMLDIDFFKNYNDTYGHQEGDECLIRVAHTIKEGLHRPFDAVCRYGGEEFVVLLPETQQEGGIIIAERIRSAIEALEIPHSTSSVSKWVTCSLGVATVIPSPLIHYDELIRMADKALYTSKTSGRNRVNNYISVNN
jgi:diguanylate cyclase (GGDEF)-like protein/PAS domain S-box-containing protein